MTRRFLPGTTVAAGLALSILLATVSARQTSDVAVGDDDLGGVVTSSKGPEAGVWVIAETTDLPTKFAKIAVTDDKGRYLLPDLPKANYRVWVRGYGLVDSSEGAGRARTRAQPHRRRRHRARRPRPSTTRPATGSRCCSVPDKSEFPGTGPTGNGIAPECQHQADWLRQVKSGGCWACHQLGNKATREIPAALGTFPSSVHAWDRRIQSGQAGGNMVNGLNALGRTRRWRCLPTGPIASPQASCRRRRRGRRASSATS